ncbi:MAG TPA: Gfo/Idh/MocA family oxidoreductase [Polyangiales bacterium]|jgi:predicted dehydrogenase|nr:Gfo/Idh/MocA family oxidoreductase [Polyangiales bacterium]
MATKAKKRVRYAVVGLGNIAQVAVLPAFQHASENSELVALISSDQDKLDKLGKRYGVKLRGDYRDLERVLAEGQVDAVYIALPNTMHREFTERAARAKVHVLCEKPMAMTEQDCQAMIDATNRHGVKLMIAYRLHFEAGNLDVIERAQRGDLGELRVFSSVFSHDVRAGGIRTRGDLGGGALFDMGIYCVNAARYVFQDEPIEAYAQQIGGRDERSASVDECTTAVLTFPEGRVAQLTASQGMADCDGYRVVGTKGSIVLDPAFEYSEAIAEKITIDGKTKTKTFEKRDQFAAELLHFSRCIQNDDSPEPSGLQGLADVRIMLALQESARTGQRVKLTPVEVGDRPSKRLETKRPPTKKVSTVHAPSPSK